MQSDDVNISGIKNDPYKLSGSTKVRFCWSVSGAKLETTELTPKTVFMVV